MGANASDELLQVLCEHILVAPRPIQLTRPAPWYVLVARGPGKASYVVSWECIGDSVMKRNALVVNGRQ